MNILIVLLVATAASLVGWQYTRLIGKMTWVEAVGLSFLVGSGLCTLAWFVLFRLGAPLNIATLTSAAAAVWLVGKIGGRGQDERSSYVKIKPDIVEKLLIGAIASMGIFHLLISSYNPITSWDSLALYDFAGRIIAINHSLKDIVESSYYMSYPLMISLLHSVVYMIGGENAQGLHSIIFCALIAIVFGRLKAWTTLRLALIGSVITITQYHLFYHASYAYTNIPYAVFVVAGFLYALSGQDKESAKGDLIIAGILFGLSTWIRSSEPFWIIGLMLIIAQSVRFKTMSGGVLATSIILAFRSVWHTFYNAILAGLHVEIPTRASLITESAVTRVLSNIPELTWYILLNIIFPYLAVWLLFIPGILVCILTKNGRLLLLLLVSLLVLGIIIAGIAVFSTYFTTWNAIGDSARRMILFVIPLSITTGVYAVSLLSKKEKHANDQ